MSNSKIRKAALAVVLGGAFACGATAVFAAGVPVNARVPSKDVKLDATLGRAATPDEIKAWNIDVRPDFQGLPPGQGSVAQGTKLWEAKCASCHGDFADSNAVFPPIVGAYQATKQDIKTGRVAKLADINDGATTIEKLSTVSTLFDYIHRAMPWNMPDSLTWDETYALVAYLLNLANVVPSNFVLTRDNVQQVQDMLPNRNGMIWNHGMWPGKEIGNGGIPDTHNTDCMKNCAPAPKITSFIPEYALNNNGNLADQYRQWGPIRGMETESKEEQEKKAKEKAAAANSPGAKVVALLKEKGCIACHSLGDNKLVGPGYKEVAAKYGGKKDMVAELTTRIIKGGSGVWGSIPMPPQSISEDDAKMIAQWIVDGAKQ
ncbi:c-type cytochrome [Thiomonas sp.]|uniref:c-type cytochrome n=1 Tax=Thiomonas sp. TaxID=2047785 RepID=UPI00185D1D87|nr:c-type cytochrome [Thiomonas sp.]